MNNKDKIALFSNFALTGSTGLYNEDSITAQQLNINSADKMKECLLKVEELAGVLATIQEVLKIDYEEETEELTLTIGQKRESLKEQINSSYVCLYDENAMTNLEQAGSNARAVNECVKTVNMLDEIVGEIEGFISLHYDPVEEMITVGGKR